MFGMGGVEILVILVVGLFVIGPDKLPEVARGVAKAFKQAQRMMGDIRDAVNLEELAEGQKDQKKPSEVKPDAFDDDAYFDDDPELETLPTASPEKTAGDDAPRDGETPPPNPTA